MEDHLETTKFTESIWERNFQTDMDVIDWIATLDKGMFKEFTDHIADPTASKSIIADIVMASNKRLTVDATVALINLGINWIRGGIQVLTNESYTSFKVIPFSAN